MRGTVPTVLDEYDYTFELGKATVLRGGNDVVFISSGLMTMRALLGANALEAHTVDVAVVHTPTIKPFDSDTVLVESNTGRLALTLENHTIRGGPFQTVASPALLAGVHTTTHPVALPDQFLDAGALPTPDQRHGLNLDSIVTPKASTASRNPPRRVRRTNAPARTAPVRTGAPVLFRQDIAVAYLIPVADPTGSAAIG